MVNNANEIYTEDNYGSKILLSLKKDGRVRERLYFTRAGKIFDANPNPNWHIFF